MFSACTTARAERRVPMCMVRGWKVDGEDETSMVGSRGEREEVEGSCSWVAMLRVVELAGGDCY